MTTHAHARLMSSSRNFTPRRKHTGGGVQPNKTRRSPSPAKDNSKRYATLSSAELRSLSIPLGTRSRAKIDENERGRAEPDVPLEPPRELRTAYQGTPMRRHKSRTKASAGSPSILGVGLGFRQPRGATSLHQIPLHAGRLNSQLVDLVLALLHRRRLQGFLSTRFAGTG